MIGGPACGSHLTAAERAALAASAEREHTEVTSRYFALAPACWEWPVTDEDRAAAALGATEDRASDALLRWQRDRCAVCGITDALVLDHDHATALIRGWLCRPCNTREGTYNNRYGYVSTVYRDYANHPPAVLLGLSLMYKGGRRRVA